MSDAIRIYLTGSCEGFDKLRDALTQQPGLEVVGYSEQAGAAASALAGGHLDCVVHGTGSPTLPAHDLLQILVPMLVWPFKYHDRSGWARFIPDLPQQWMVSDPDVYNP